MLYKYSVASVRISSPESPGLYVHVPFCRSKCGYCDFYSRPLAESCGAVDRYLSALERELIQLPDGFAPGTIYIGGGTPTALPLPALKRLLSMLHERVDVSGVKEWTCEANPGTLDAALAGCLTDHGVNRVSLGVQSLDPDRLKLLGRLHTPDDAVRAFGVLRTAGIAQVSADLMFGIPGQDTPAFERDLQGLLALRPDHVSAYALSIEPGTPFAKMERNGLLIPVDEATEAEQYELATDHLSAAGLPPYEISNFARAGSACRHNIGYWTGLPYAGVGPSAHGYLDGVRFANVPDLDGWASALESDRSARAFEERLAPDARAREALILELRMAAGVDAERFRARHGMDPEGLRPGETRALFEAGLLERTPNGFRLAPRARFISDTVFRELV